MMTNFQSLFFTISGLKGTLKLSVSAYSMLYSSFTTISGCNISSYLEKLIEEIQNDIAITVKLLQNPEYRNYAMDPIFKL